MSLRLPVILLTLTAVLTSYFYLRAKTEAGEPHGAHLQPLDSIQREGLQGIRPQALRAHLEFLADDLLAGRDTGSNGARLAALYIANQFKRIGLEPVGPDQSYYQSVPLYKLHPRPELEVRLEISGQMVLLQEEKDFLVVRHPEVDDFELTRDMVFTGFGICAPEHNYDDFAGVDVRSKVSVWLAGEPPASKESFSDVIGTTKYATGGAKRQIARSLGAVGTVTIMSRDLLPRFRWGKGAGAFTRRRLSLRPPKPRPENDAFPAIVLHPDAAARLFSDIQQDYDQVLARTAQGNASSFAMDRKISFKTVRLDSMIEGRNVLAFLAGSDPKLKNEIVVFTAHYDHIGLGTAVKGDSIYNGAADNASGVAGLIELAQAFSDLKDRPRRSLLFLALTAEEQGLLGSEYYVKHPVFPLENTVANLNLDIIGIGEDHGVVVYGLEKSSLGEVVRAAAMALGLQILPDELPEEHLYERSDHFNFATAGVPAIYPGIGLDKKSLATFLTYYHKPNDDAGLPFDYDYMVRHVQLLFLAGLKVANADDRPGWTPKSTLQQVP